MIKKEMNELKETNEFMLRVNIGVLILFGILDSATTIYAVGYLGAIEVNPLMNSVIETFGIWSLLIVKVIGTLMVAGVWMWVVRSSFFKKEQSKFMILLTTYIFITVTSTIVVVNNLIVIGLML